MGVSIAAVDDIDGIKQTTQGAKVWVERIQEETFKHATKLMQLHMRKLVVLHPVHGGIMGRAYLPR